MAILMRGRIVAARVYQKLSSVLFCDNSGDAKSQPGAVFLVCHKRFKKIGEIFLRDTGTVVSDMDRYGFAVAFGRQKDPSGFPGDGDVFVRATRGDGIGRIEKQIHDRLPKLLFIRYEDETGESIRQFSGKTDSTHFHGRRERSRELRQKFRDIQGRRLKPVKGRGHILQ